MHKIVLSGYNAYLEKNGNKRLYLGTAESYGIEKLQILAESGWDDLSLITATFHPPNGDAVRVIIGENGVVEVPKEATAVPAPEHDPGMIVFSGVKEGMQRISTNILYIIGEHAGANGAVTDDTPSEWEQLINIYESKFDKNQGKENAGKILGVDESGEIIPVAKVNWDQNNNSQLNFVENRTHYRVQEEPVTIFNETADFSENGFALLSDEAYQAVMSADPTKTYRFKLNDVVISEDKIVVNSKGNRVVANGYADLDGSGQVNFMILASRTTARATISSYLTKMFYGVVNASLEMVSYVYHPLDEKYIPDTILREADIATDRDILELEAVINGSQLIESKDGSLYVNNGGTAYII